MRNRSIDLLKCLAVLCIFNAHSTMLYPVWPWLSTGGYVGDALFFFCSGYTLFLDNGSRLCRFDNWYKRRLGRIWPSCLAWGLIAGLFSLQDISIVNAFQGVKWFVKCILVYYIIMWFIGKLFISHMRKVLLISLILSIVTLFYMRYVNNIGLWKPVYFFPVIVFGALMGKCNDGRTYPFWTNALWAFVAFSIFTGLIAFGTRVESIACAHYVPAVSLPFLIVFCFYIYRAGSSDVIANLAQKRLVWEPIIWTGSLCLDFYLVKWTFISDKLNAVFPLNLPLMLVYLLLIAYLLRSVGRFLQQTLSPGKQPYDWIAVFRLAP